MRWILAGHIIGIVMWFAGLFYLPRLFVYHSMIPSDDELGNSRFKTMENKLYLIMTISLFIMAFFGFWLLKLNPALVFSLWFQIKLLLILSLIIFHFYCGHIVKIFRENQNSHTHKFYRWLNEYPAVILITVVILAVINSN